MEETHLSTVTLVEGTLDSLNVPWTRPENGNTKEIHSKKPQGSRFILLSVRCYKKHCSLYHTDRQSSVIYSIHEQCWVISTCTLQVYLWGTHPGGPIVEAN